MHILFCLRMTADFDNTQLIISSFCYLESNPTEYPLHIQLLQSFTFPSREELTNRIVNKYNGISVYNCIHGRNESLQIKVTNSNWSYYGKLQIYLGCSCNRSLGTYSMCMSSPYVPKNPLFGTHFMIVQLNQDQLDLLSCDSSFLKSPSFFFCDRADKKTDLKCSECNHWSEA